MCFRILKLLHIKKKSRPFLFIKILRSGGWTKKKILYNPITWKQYYTLNPVCIIIYSTWNTWWKLNVMKNYIIFTSYTLLNGIHFNAFFIERTYTHPHIYVGILVDKKKKNPAFQPSRYSPIIPEKCEIYSFFFQVTWDNLLCSMVWYIYIDIT